MHRNSHSFEELDVTELLDDYTETQSQPHRAYQHIKNNEDLFNSHFCDQEYYVPVKKRSMSFQFMGQEEEVRKGKEEGVGKGMEKVKRAGRGGQNIANARNKQKVPTFSKQQKVPAPNTSAISQPSLNRQLKGTQSALQLRPRESEQNIQRPKQIIKQACSVQLINFKYYIQLEGISIPVSDQSMKFIQEEFMKMNMCVPFFSFRRFHEWEGSSVEVKVNQEDQTHRLFKYSLARYLKYLFQCHPSQLREIFNDPSLRKRLQITQKSSFWKLEFLNTALSNIKGYIYTSKLQILQKSLLAKSRSFTEAKKTLKKWYDLGDLLHTLTKQEDQLWKQIEALQFMICLEDSEKYCEQRMGESKQGKMKEYWTKYRNTMKKELERQKAEIGTISL